MMMAGNKSTNGLGAKEGEGVGSVSDITTTELEWSEICKIISDEKAVTA